MSLPSVRTRGLVLAAMVLLCFMPRAIMAWKLRGVCPDAVFYIQVSDSLEQSRFEDAFQRLQFNVFPVILMLLHRLGLPWETAGAWWGVLISSCTVLPLWGWIRRQFDERVALTACFLYAIHSTLIRWSPEILRDPTFWFLFTLSLYCSWRAVTEARWPLFLAAGVATALAALTRFEGLLLLMPLVCWSVGRGVARPELRRRLVLGGLTSAGVYPLLLVLVSSLWVQSYAPWQLIRAEPVKLAGQWAQSGWTGRDRQSDDNLPWGARPAPLSLPQSIERFTCGMVKGLTPLFMLLLAGGASGQAMKQYGRHRRVLFAMSLLVLLEIWVHLWSARATCERYFFSVVILTLPYAALGLLRVSAALGRLLQGSRHTPCAVRPMVAHFRGRHDDHASVVFGLPNRASCTAGQASSGIRTLLASWRSAIAAPALPALAAAALSLTLLAARDCRFRAATAELGRWIRGQCGPECRVLGPDGVTQVVSYYAAAQCRSFSPETPDAKIVACVRRTAPDVVLLPADRKARQGADLLRRIEDCGFVEVDRSRFSGGCRTLWVLARRLPADSSLAEGAPDRG